MKTNTNMNNVIDFFTTHLSKLSQLISETSSSKLNVTFCKTTFLLFFVFNTSIVLGQTGSVAELKVEKNRTSRSTPPEGTYYKMVISNLGNSVDTYVLSYVNVNKNCSNPDASSSEKNVILDVEFLDKNLKPLNEVRLNPRETFVFFAHIIVPKGTSIGKWACTQVIAKSRLNSKYKVDTILHTLVINPNEDK